MAQFDTVINIPPDILFDPDISTGTQVNVRRNGALDFDYFETRGSAELNLLGGLLFDVVSHDESTVNIADGTAFGTIAAYDNSTVSISGGQISAPFRAFDTSNVNLSGGAFRFDSSFDSEVSLTIVGGDFRVDGESVQGLGIGEQAVIGLGDHHELSGILEDGTPFVLFDADSFDMGTVTLTGAALPPLEAFEFNLPADVAPQTLRGPQTVTVADSGRLPQNFRAGHGSTVRILNGGQVSSRFMSIGAEVEVTGGQLGPFANAFGGSTISLNGGSIDGGLFAVNSTINLHDGELESRTGTSPFIATNSVLNVAGGDVIGSGFTAFNSTINLSAGTISSLTANNSSEVNVSGGILNNFTAESGTLVNISGGVVRDFLLGQETTVNISGGTVVPDSPNRILESSPGTTVTVSGGLVVDNRFYVPPDGELRIRGGEFRLDGNEVPDLGNVGDMVSLPFEYPSTITATLSDGTPFIYQRAESHRDLTITLIADEVAPNDGPRQITAPIDMVPQSLRDGQSLTVDDGGLVHDYFRAGAGSSVLLKSGGQIADYMDLIDANLTIEGGTVGTWLEAHGNSTIRLLDGTVGDLMIAKPGSTIEIQGGFARGIAARDGSTINMSAGTIGTRFGASKNSLLNITGGTIADDGLRLQPGAMVRLAGAEFRLNGQPVEGLENVGDSVVVDIPDGSHFFGTLSDGTPFILEHLVDWNEVGTLQLNLERTELPPSGPAEINASVDEVPTAIHHGQTLMIGDGAFVSGYFRAGSGSTIDVQAGGTLGSFSDAINATVNVDGGSIGYFDAYDSSIVNIKNGEATGRIRAKLGSTVNISGGQVSTVVAYNDATVNIHDGVVDFVQTGDSFAPSNRIPGGRINMTGGTIEFELSGMSGSEINISGGEVLGRRFTIARSGSTWSISGGVVNGLVGHPGSVVEINDGRIGDEFETAGTVHVRGGEIGVEFVGEPGSDIHIGGGTIVEDLKSEGRVTMTAGTIGDDLIAKENSLVEISGGMIMDNVDARTGGHVIVRGGTVGNDLEVEAGGTVVVHGGTIQNDLETEANSTVILHGGQIDDAIEASGFVEFRGGSVGGRFDAGSGSEVRIYGGDVGEHFFARNGSVVEIVASEFHLDEMRIGELAAAGDSLVLIERNAALDAQFSDDSTFRFNLNSNCSLDEGCFSTDAMLRLTVVLAEGACDFDGDSECGIADIDLLVAATGSDNLAFDLNGSGSVDTEDIDAWLSSVGITSIGRPFLAGDANLDGITDARDLNVVGLNWLSNANAWSQGDFNGDAMVDSLDLNKIGLSWQQPAIPVVAVPEPGFAAWWVIGLIACLQRRKRRRCLDPAGRS